MCRWLVTSLVNKTGSVNIHRYRIEGRDRIAGNRILFANTFAFSSSPSLLFFVPRLPWSRHFNFCHVSYSVFRISQIMFFFSRYALLFLYRNRKRRNKCMLCCTCHHVYVTCYCGLVWCELVLLEFFCLPFISWLVLCHAVQLSDFQTSRVSFISDIYR